MGYRIQSQPNNKWRLIYEDNTVKPRKDRHIKHAECPRLGFSEAMSIESAREHCRHLNTKDKLERRNAAKHRIAARLKAEDEEQLAHLPAYLITKFEREDLEAFYPKGHKIFFHWKRCKRLLVDLKLDVAELHAKRELIFRHFSANQISYDYARKLVYLLNRYGRFVSLTKQSFFLPLPNPKAAQRERIVDAYFDKEGQGKESSPLTPQLLEGLRTKLSVEQFNWMYLSLWLGLRPSEVNSLKSSSNFVFAKQGEYDVLKVYQSKLTSVARAKRWKIIPLFHAAHRAVPSIVASGSFACPLVKTLHKYLGENYNTYAGRKGFTDLMLSLDQPIEAISAWLGHQSLDRTIRSYKDRDKLFMPRKAA